MFTLRRLTVPGLNAIFITGALLYLMFLLIKTDEPQLTQGPVFLFPPISKPVEELEVEPIVAKPPLPEEVAVAPSVPDINEVLNIAEIEGPAMGEPMFHQEKKGLPMPLDNQLILVLGYPPTYPPQLIHREVEGYAVVGFSVSAAGAVFDAFIIESEPGSVFDRASLKAITKFKYQARMVNGKPVASNGQRYLFRYKLDD